MMSAGEQAQAASAAAETTQAGDSLLEQAITATKHTERSRAEELISTLTDEALKGTMTWSKNVTATITTATTLMTTNRNVTMPFSFCTAARSWACSCSHVRVKR